jgi:hypothetical protein
MKKLHSIALTAMLTFASCSSQQPSVEPTKLTTPIVKEEVYQKTAEATIVGRSYSPGFAVDKKVKVSYGNIILNENAHEHEIPIQLSQSERYFLFVEIGGKTVVKEVNKNMFRDTPDNTPVIVHYNETRLSTYQQSAELEKMSDELSNLEIISLELKK